MIKIKRHKAIIELSRDHKKGLMLAQLLKKNAPAYKGLPTDVEGKMKYAIETLQQVLIKHFEDEEKNIFPALKGKSKEFDELVEELLKEHLFFFNEISALKYSEKLSDQLNLIGFKLESHIRKEERTLFNLIQELLSEDELRDIENNIQKSRKDFSKKCKT